jgi:hypothetical protein
MAHAAGRISTDGMFLRKHAAEPLSSARVLGQGRMPFYLKISAGL